MHAAKPKRIAVLGGGIAGLAAAHAQGEGRRGSHCVECHVIAVRARYRVVAYFYHSRASRASFAGLAARTLPRAHRWSQQE